MLSEQFSFTPNNNRYFIQRCFLVFYFNCLARIWLVGPVVPPRIQGYVPQYVNIAQGRVTLIPGSQQGVGRKWEGEKKESLVSTIGARAELFAQHNH